MLTPGGGNGQIAAGGSVEVYAGAVGAGDSGILAGAAFETDPTFRTTNTGSNEDLTEVTFQSASAGQIPSALSPLAVFDEGTQEALETTVIGEDLFAAAEGTIQVIALEPSVMTHGKTMSNVTDTVTSTVGGVFTSVGTDVTFSKDITLVTFSKDTLIFSLPVLVQARPGGVGGGKP